MDSNMKNLYYKIPFYKKIIFDKFLEQLEKGNISIQFIVSTFKEGRRSGQIHNHGTDLQLKKRI